MNLIQTLQKLPRSFYAQDTRTVAQALLGTYLIYQDRIGKIVEVEAYLGQHDLACHASKGITPRTQVMYGQAGHAYVYLIYGKYHCLNVVTEQEGIGAAVLLRAIEPIQNITERTQGPGLLTQAMHIDKSLNGYDLLSDHFFIARPSIQEPISIVEKPRIGVHYAQHWAHELLRFYIKGNVFVSKL
jgi:DNA-3-methyladenine glycosylase